MCMDVMERKISDANNIQELKNVKHHLTFGSGCLVKLLLLNHHHLVGFQLSHKSST